MAARLSNNSRTMIAAAALLVAAGGAYVAVRLSPPSGGPTTGTITAAERYRSSQIGAADVQLGDTGVANLMQTDTFQLMVKNPQFRKLASDPAFIALAQNHDALTAMTQNPELFAQLGQNRQLFMLLADAA